METSSRFDAMPDDLHGHKEKLAFFLEELKAFTSKNLLSPAQVSVLEIGCGNGTVVTLPVAEFGYRMTGVDMHQPSIDHARSLIKGEEVRFVCADVAELGFEGQYDVVILSDILEHVDSPTSLMQLACGCVRDGGVVLISVPNGYGPSELERRICERVGIDRLVQLARRVYKKYTGRVSTAYNYDSGHIQFFRLANISRMTNDAGLVIYRKKKGALFGGTLTYPASKLFPWIIKPSLRLAKHLPFQIISTWYFACEKSAENKIFGVKDVK